MTRRRPVAVGLLAAAALAAGCGREDEPGPPPLDLTWLQRDLTSRFNRQTGAEVASMACPTVEPRRGRRFECSAAFDGEPGVVEVTLLDDQTRPRYRARLKNLLLGPLERAIQQRLARAGVPVASVDCPGPVPQRRGRVSICSVEYRRGGRSDLRVEQVDDRGNIRFSPLRRAPPRGGR